MMFVLVLMMGTDTDTDTFFFLLIFFLVIENDIRYAMTCAKVKEKNPLISDFHHKIFIQNFQCTYGDERF